MRSSLIESGRVVSAGVRQAPRARYLPVAEHDAIGPNRVTLRRTAPLDPEPYRDLLGDVRFGAERDRCTFDAASLATRLELADPAILAALEPYAERRVTEQGRAWSAVVAEISLGV